MSAPAPCLPHLGVPEHGDAPKMQHHNSWDGHGDAGPHQFGQFLDAQHRPAGPGSWHPAGGNDGGATGSRRSRSSSRSSRRGSRVSDRRSLDSQATSGSDGSHISKRSLPREAGFVSPPFRIVPPWLPVSERGVMRTLLVVTAAVCIGNLVAYGWLQATRSK
ncbi:hypothetical protein HK105_201862 [Polyrhizophydium stewartii]|uniref:Uncharacterized protein n=1 Tax=Polyrhizophydium stewartii TaxID=2732419 RepID=A0ABR4NG31_9FUNG